MLKCFLIIIISQSVIKPFQNQVYEDIIKQHNPQNLFTDNAFPPNEKSLYHSATRPECIIEGTVWKRASVC